jgi:SUF system FeS cluster assembly, SufBD
MKNAEGQLEVVKITDLAAMLNLEIKQGQNLQVQFESTKCTLQPIVLKIVQHQNSILQLVLLITNSIELGLDLVIVGDQTSTSIHNLVDLNGTSNVRLNQKISTSFDNNHINHLTKCLLDGNSRASIRHLIKAIPTTQNLTLNQKIQTLSLSPTAKTQMQPIMQIESNDVQCKHGATQGFLDMQAIFYLQSRGLSMSISKQVLIDVFKSEILSLVQI